MVPINLIATVVRSGYTCCNQCDKSNFYLGLCCIMLVGEVVAEGTEEEAAAAIVVDLIMDVVVGVEVCIP